MHIYLSGIGGVGLGPLAEIARGAGYDVSGSDRNASLTTNELTAQGIEVVIYPQDGSLLRQIHAERPIDWFVYTSALADDHPELLAARELGIRVSKRDELLSAIIEEKKLRLIAVSGTHGKTTTTGMFVWAFMQLGIPISYSVGTTLSYGPSGLFDKSSKYFVYECDEYDRNFLAFHPHEAVITTVDHDHFDTYPTLADYTDAFTRFAGQSGHVTAWTDTEAALGRAANIEYVRTVDTGLTLAGEHNRRNASLVLDVLRRILPTDPKDVLAALNDFPGTNRRFEKLNGTLYSDYGHHPVEIAATLQMAHELSDRVVLVYQPHQNSRQHEVRDDYTAEVFRHADRVIWLPTYLTRENNDQAVLSPQELSTSISEKTTYAQLDDSLWIEIERELSNGSLVLCMGAGTIDGWLRAKLAG